MTVYFATVRDEPIQLFTRDAEHFPTVLYRRCGLVPVARSRRQNPAKLIEVKGGHDLFCSMPMAQVHRIKRPTIEAD